METVSLRRQAKKNTVNQPCCPSDRCVMAIQVLPCSAGGTAKPGYAVFFLLPSFEARLWLFLFSAGNLELAGGPCAAQATFQTVKTTEC